MGALFCVPPRGFGPGGALKAGAPSLYSPYGV